MKVWCCPKFGGIGVLVQGHENGLMSKKGKNLYLKLKKDYFWINSKLHQLTPPRQPKKHSGEENSISDKN